MPRLPPVARRDWPWIVVEDVCGARAVLIPLGGLVLVDRIQESRAGHGIRQAVDARNKWRFEPGKKDGRAENDGEPACGNVDR